VRRRQASHVTVVLSKAALSGPSVCLRARAPCPLRVSCPGADRAKRAAKLQALALRCLLGSRQVFGIQFSVTKQNLNALCHVTLSHTYLATPKRHRRTVCFKHALRES
jgi:hypothetical protein